MKQGVNRSDAWGRERGCHSHHERPSRMSIWTASLACRTLSMTFWACCSVLSARSCRSTIDRFCNETLFFRCEGDTEPGSTTQPGFSPPLLCLQISQPCLSFPPHPSIGPSAQPALSPLPRISPSAQSPPLPPDRPLGPSYPALQWAAGSLPFLPLVLATPAHRYAWRWNSHAPGPQRSRCGLL